MSFGEFLLQTLAAAAGTVAFSVLYGIPGRLYRYCAAVGGMGWLLYLLLKQLTAVPESLAVFLATVLVVFLSRSFAVRERCAATVFVTSGVFPLVPGAGIYWTAWYLISGRSGEALASGMSAVKDVFAIVLGIVVVFELPQRLFAWIGGGKRA